MATEFISNSWLMPTNANAEANRVSNYSLDCDGAAQHLTFASVGDSFGNNEAFTFSFWCKVNTMAAYKAFFDFSPPTGFGLLALRTISTSVIELLKSGSSLGTYTFSDTTNFHNFCIVYDKTNIKLYIDNVEVISSAQTNIGDFTGLDLYLANGYFLTSRLDCKLTEVSIFDYALSSSQRTELYGTGSAIGNPMAITNGRKPVAYYPLGNAAFNGEFLASNGAEQDYVFDFVPNDYIDCGTELGDALGTVTNLSISTWVKAPSTAINDFTFNISSFSNSYGAINFNIHSNKLTVRLNNDSGRFSLNPFTSTDWNNVVFVYDGSSQSNSKLYINGQLQSITFSGSFPSTLNLSGLKTIIGAGYSPSFSFDGLISNTAVFNTALPATGTESVASLYNYGTPPNIASYSNLQAWWELDASATFDGSNWSIPDASSNSNTGTSSGMTVANLVQSDLIINAPYDSFSLDFDGANDYISSNNIGISGLNNASVSVWVKPTGSTSSTYRSIVNQWEATNSAWGLWLNGTGSTYRIHWNQAGASGVNSGLIIPKDEWSHIAIVKNATTLKMFYNGSEVNSFSISAATGSGATILNIAAQYTSTSAVTFFNGNISNVSIYNSELSAAQVTTLYNEGKPFDLNTFAVTPVSWWRLGASGSSFDGSNWTILDEISTSGNNGTSANMTQADLVDGVGATGSGTSSGMGSGENRKGSAPFSENNAVSYNLSVLAKSSSTPT